MAGQTGDQHSAEVHPRLARVRLCGALLTSVVVVAALGLAPIAASAATTTAPLDPSYGVNGIGTFDVAPAMPGTGTVGGSFAATDPAGRTVLLGQRSIDNRMVVLRLNADGTMDRTFATSGAQVLPAGFGPMRLRATAGGIVASGLYLTPDGSTASAAVVRLSPDGSVDTAFGTAGMVTVPAPTGTAAFGFDVDLGGSGEVTLSVRSTPAGVNSYDLYRFLANGTRDPGFGTGGVVHLASGPIDGSVFFRVDSAGGTVVESTTNPGATSATSTLRRLLPDGSTDATFGNAGSVALGSGVVDMVEISSTDGSILAGGSLGPDNSTGHSRLWKVTSGGVLDTHFGQGGVVALDTARTTDILAAITPLPDGHVAAVTTDFASGVIAFLRADGTPDPAFGASGQLATQAPIFGGLGAGANGRLLLTSASAAATGTQSTFTTRALRIAAGPTTPAAVTAVTARQGALSVTWTPAADAGDPVRAYYVAALDGGAVAGGTAVSADVRQTSISGLTNGRPYQVVVVPYTASGPGATSAIVTGTPSATAPPVAPAAPVQNVAATGGNAFATVTWSPPADDGGAPISVYSVIAINHATGALAAWRNLPSDARTAAIPALTNSTTYDLYVLAATGAGFGQLALAVTATPLATGAAAAAPSIPWAAAVQVGPNAVVTWGPPTEQGQTATHVNVIAIQNGAMTAWQVTGPDQRHTSIPLASAGTAQIYVIAQSQTGYGPLGTPLTVTP